MQQRNVGGFHRSQIDAAPIEEPLGFAGWIRKHGAKSPGTEGYRYCTSYGILAVGEPYLATARSPSNRLSWRHARVWRCMSGDRMSLRPTPRRRTESPASSRGPTSVYSSASAVATMVVASSVGAGSAVWRVITRKSGH